MSWRPGYVEPFFSLCGPSIFTLLVKIIWICCAAFAFKNAVLDDRGVVRRLSDLF